VSRRKLFGCRGLIYGLDSPDLGDVGLEVALDAGLEGDRGGGATHAGAVHADLDGVVGGEADELDVPAVGLNGWADEFDDAADAVGERGGRGVEGGRGRRGVERVEAGHCARIVGEGGGRDGRREQ